MVNARRSIAGVRPTLRGDGHRWTWRVLGLCVLAAAVTSGCAKARAETVADGPPLATPAPPPRVLMPVDEPLASNPIAPDKPAVSAPQIPPRQAARRANAANSEPERTEPVVGPPAPPVTAPPAASETPRELRAASSPADAEAERKVRDMLLTAARNLNGVDYRKLTKEGQSQYDQAKRFADQTDEALKERNLVLAETLADKAVKLAAELLGR